MTDWTVPRRRATGEIISRELLQTQFIDNVTFLYEARPEIGYAFTAAATATNAAWTTIPVTLVTLTLNKVADVYVLGWVKWDGGIGNEKVEFRVYNSTDSVAGDSTGKFGIDDLMNNKFSAVAGYFADVAAGAKTFVLQEQGAACTARAHTMIAVGLYEQ